MKKRWKSASNEVNEPYFFSENATKNNKWFIIKNIPSLPDIFSIDHKTKQHVKISKLENCDQILKMTALRNGTLARVHIELVHIVHKDDYLLLPKASEHMPNLTANKLASFGVILYQ